MPRIGAKERLEPYQSELPRPITSLDNDTVILMPGEAAVITLSVYAMPTTQPGEYTYTVIGNSTGNANASDIALTYTTVLYSGASLSAGKATPSEYVEDEPSPAPEPFTPRSPIPNLPTALRARSKTECGCRCRCRYG